MPTQLKFVVEDDLAERFKRAVLEKHGKLQLSKEGEEAIRLYLLERRRRRSTKRRDPLLDIIGMLDSGPRGKGKRRPNAVRDKKALALRRGA